MSGPTLSVVRGDITQQDVYASLNASNFSRLGGSLLDGLERQDHNQ